MLKTTWHRKSLTALAGTLALGMMAGPGAADETDARNILAAMSDYMTAQQSFAFDFDSILEVVTTEDQKIGLASSGTVAVTRPDRLHATRKGGFADIELGYDGQTVTLIGHNAGVYTEIPAEGSIEAMIETLRSDQGVVLPAADLLETDPAAILLEGVTDVKDLGSGVIGGQECDHIALRSDELDIQLWIAQGDAPHPCRYSIAARTVAQQPEYTVVVRNWTDSATDAALAVTIPDRAEKVDAGALTRLTQELPEAFNTGAAQ